MLKFGKIWTVMAFGIVLHELLEWFMPEFPLFNIITIVALLFMVKSQASLSVYLFDTLITPILTKVEPSLDSALTSVEGSMEKQKDGLAEVGKKIIDSAKDAITKDKPS